MALFPGNLRRVARTNVALCYPELPPREQARRVRAGLANTARAATESAALWLWPRERALALVVETRGEEHLRAAMAAGKGAILAGPHIGAWELVGLYCGARYPMTALYRPLRLAELDALVHQAREKSGATLVPTDARGIRSLYQAMARGDAVGILPDQEPGGGAGVFAPFFGVPAYTMVLLSRMAAKAGAPVIFTFAERLPRGRGFRMHFIPAPEGIADPDPVVAATALNRGVEQCIAIAPDQYQWAYKRFRSRPDGEPRFY